MLLRALQVFFVAMAAGGVLCAIVLMVTGQNAIAVAVPYAAVGALNFGAFKVRTQKGLRVLCQALSAFILLWLAFLVALSTTSGTPDAQLWVALAYGSLIGVALEVLSIPVGLLVRRTVPTVSDAVN